MKANFVYIALLASLCALSQAELNDAQRQAVEILTSHRTTKTATAAASAAATPTAYIRLTSVSLVNSLPVTLTVAGTPLITNIGSFQVSPYTGTTQVGDAINLSVGSASLTQTILANSSYTVVYYDASSVSSTILLLHDNVQRVDDYDYDPNEGSARFVNVLAGSSSIDVAVQTTNCFECAFPKPTGLAAGAATKYTVVKTDFAQQIRLSTASEYEVNTLTHLFGEHGTETVLIYGNVSYGYAHIFVLIDVPGFNSYEPLYIATGAIVGLAILFALAQRLYLWFMGERKITLRTAPEYERLINDSWDAKARATELTRGEGDVADFQDPARVVIATVTADSSQQQDETKKPSKNRLRSLDTFRGLSLSIMIFANYGGGGYWFFNHSAWNGITVADLVFPWFIFMMGVSMALSYKSILRRRPPALSVLYKIVRRSLILVALGLFLNNGYNLEHWRIPGVLQRFGISYFFVAIIIYFVPAHDGVKGPLRDIFMHWKQWLIVLLIMVTWLIATFVPQLDNCPRGYIGPGGKYGSYGDYPDCTGGTAWWLDMKVFGYNHMYHSPTCKETYGTGAFDPEGLLGVLNSIVITYLGYAIGRILVTYEEHGARLKRLTIWGVTLCLLATGLCAGSQNDGPLPLNKNLWSTSFIFCMAGTGTLMLTVCYILIDLQQYWNGAPFVYMGMNSIAVYLGSELFQDRFPFSYRTPNTHAAQLPMDLIGVMSWLLIAYYCYTIDFFVKI